VARAHQEALVGLPGPKRDYETVRELGDEHRRNYPRRIAM